MSRGFENFKKIYHPLRGTCYNGAILKMGGTFMTLEEAMRSRHTVRRYTDRKIPEETLAALRQRIGEHNQAYSLAMSLVTDNTEAFGPAPAWFDKGVEALLLAPTALNKQAFTVRREGRKVSLTCSSGVFSGVDLGIGKYHFELGAGRENFDWA